MKSTLLELVTSKKFLAMLTAVAVCAAGRLGFDLDTAVLDRIFAALLVYVGAQGVADAGKSAAQIRAVTATAGMTPESSDALKRIASSTLVVSVAVMLLGAGLALQPACGGAPKPKEVAVAAKDAVIHCVKADAGQLLALTGELAANAVGSALHAQGIDWDSLVARAKAAGATVGGCAFAALYKALDDAEPAMMTRSLTDVPDARRSVLAHLREAFGGPRWELAGGVVL